MYQYERIEEMGLTTFSKKPIQKRNQFLIKSEADELLCFFQIMDANEFPLFFSVDTIIEAFKRIPSNEIFQVLYHLSKSDIDFFFTRNTIQSKFKNMSLDHFMCDIEYHSSVLFLLVDLKYITEKDIYQKMNIMNTNSNIISRLCKQKQFRSVFSDYIEFMKLVLKNRMKLPCELIDSILFFLI
jgi:hypothetical protein